MNTDTPELERLRRFVVDLNVQWQMFDDLFGFPQNAVLFHRAAPQFWETLKQYLVDLLFLTVSRFFDPASTGGQQNFTLANVLDLAELTAIRQDLQARLDRARQIWESGIKVWRHKRISHSDKRFAMGQATLPDVSFESLRELVQGITAIVQEIDHRLNHVGVSYHIGIDRWVPELLDCLRAGIASRDAKRLTCERMPSEGKDENG